MDDHEKAQSSATLGNSPPMQPIIRGGTDETTSLCNSAGGSVLTVFHVYVPFLFSGFLIILLTVLLVQCLCHVHWTAEVAVGALRLH